VVAYRARALKDIRLFFHPFQEVGLNNREGRINGHAESLDFTGLIFSLDVPL
jgi:hypothetical protein